MSAGVVPGFQLTLVRSALVPSAMLVIRIFHDKDLTHVGGCLLLMFVIYLALYAVYACSQIKSSSTIKSNVVS